MLTTTKLSLPELRENEIPTRYSTYAGLLSSTFEAESPDWWAEDNEDHGYYGGE